MNPFELERRRNLVAILLLIANIFGATIFLEVASSTWIEPFLANESGAGGGAPFIWFLTAVPIFLFFVLVNFGVLIWASIVHRRQGQWPISKFFWLCLPLWICTLVVDSVHHGV